MQTPQDDRFKTAPPEDIATSVARLNASLASSPLPDSSLRIIAAAADTSLTLQRLAAVDKGEFFSDKQNRYAMFVPFADAFWNTVKDVPIRIAAVTDLPDSAHSRNLTIRAGERSKVLLPFSLENVGANLSRIQHVITAAFLGAMNSELAECKLANPHLSPDFQYCCARIVSGSMEGSQLVMSIAQALIKDPWEAAEIPLAPRDFNWNLDSQLSQIKQIMRLNILADEFLDALLYGNQALFTCIRSTDPGAVYSIAFRPANVDLMEEIGRRFCIAMKDQPLEIIETFEAIHGCIRQHLSDEVCLSHSYELTQRFAHEIYKIEDELPEANPIKILRELEAKLFRDLQDTELSEWHPQKREFLMTLLFLKGVVSWHTDPDVRPTSGCPMLFSKQLVPWLEKICTPIKDWYALSLDQGYQATNL